MHTKGTVEDWKRRFSRMSTAQQSLLIDTASALGTVCEGLIAEQGESAEVALRMTFRNGVKTTSSHFTGVPFRLVADHYRSDQRTGSAPAPQVLDACTVILTACTEVLADRDDTAATAA